MSEGALKLGLGLLGGAAGYFDAKSQDGKTYGGNPQSEAWFRQRANQQFAAPQFSTGLLGSPWNKF